MTLRQAMQGLAALASTALATTTAAARSEARTGTTAAQRGDIGPLATDVLPDGVRSRFVHNINGLRIHVLETGFEDGNRPGVLGSMASPELAYSWRNVMVPLADAGYHVFAPDQRGYGRTTVQRHSTGVGGLVLAGPQPPCRGFLRAPLRGG